jgi:hypothetical protein
MFNFMRKSEVPYSTASLSPTKAIVVKGKLPTHRELLEWSQSLEQENLLVHSCYEFWKPRPAFHCRFRFFDHYNVLVLGTCSSVYILSMVSFREHLPFPLRYDISLYPTRREAPLELVSPMELVSPQWNLGLDRLIDRLDCAVRRLPLHEASVSVGL